MFTRGSPMHQKCSNYALTNLLFGLCKSVWIIDPLITRFNPHPETPTRPSTPKVLWAKERTPTFYPFVIFTLNLKLILSRSLGVQNITPLVFAFYSKRLFKSSRGLCLLQKVYGGWLVFFFHVPHVCPILTTHGKIFWPPIFVDV